MSNPAYKNTALSIEERVNDLVSRMTLEEKVSQMLHTAPAIERLDIPQYNWWNEALHGVARAGIATVFPQAIGMAASWNTDLIHEIATVTGDEARSKYHDAVRQGNRDQYYGLTFWSPNVNIFRDPRWGRGQETYGEDPYLTARLGVTFIKALQGDDPTYMKAAACAKHFAVHSGPENERHQFNAVVTQKDLWETYLPAFEACVREAAVESVMGAYNRTNGEPCCGSKSLLVDILRGKWEFQGHVVSDCWAIQDFYLHHKVLGTAEESAALAVNMGCDLNCGSTYPALVSAVEQGLITEETITRSVSRLFMTRFKLGMFDPDEDVRWAQIPIEVNDSDEHRALSLRAARESIVLLKNVHAFLPLDKSTIQSIAVIGPNADDPMVLLGNYNGFPSKSVTPLEGIRNKVGTGVDVHYTKGSHIWQNDSSGYDEAMEIARQADVVIFVGGLNQGMEGEEGAGAGLPDGEQGQGDRTDIALPATQEELLKAISATGTPVVLVLLNGSALAVNWADEHLPAIVEAWYPGQEGGTAIADVLFGDYNPGGRLPVTFYRSVRDLPHFRDYNMTNRTYRYFSQDPLYPFGFGLSFTTFAYSNLRFSTDTIRDGESLTVCVDVTNTGSRAGDEVVQLYITDVDATFIVPIRSLQGFQRIHLAPSETKTVEFTLESDQFALVDNRGDRVLEPGVFEVYVGGGQPIGINAGIPMGTVTAVG